jgi:HAD superfamily hydrolase (TIGR01509 family)
MINFDSIKAILFDMDGTLIDSERNTEISVKELLTKSGLDARLINTKRFYGITWQKIESILQDQFPSLLNLPIKERLQKRFHELFFDTPEVPGATDFIKKISPKYKTAIVTSSNRESVENLIERFELKKNLHLYVCTGDYVNSKPDPECYLLTAKKLNVSPSECLVFEDSIPGMVAARAAGMQLIAVTHNSPDLQKAIELSAFTIENFLNLQFPISDI